MMSLPLDRMLDTAEQTRPSGLGLLSDSWHCTLSEVSAGSHRGHEGEPYQVHCAFCVPSSVDAWPSGIYRAVPFQTRGLHRQPTYRSTALLAASSNARDLAMTRHSRDSLLPTPEAPLLRVDWLPRRPAGPYSPAWGLLWGKLHQPRYRDNLPLRDVVSTAHTPGSTAASNARSSNPI